MIIRKLENSTIVVIKTSYTPNQEQVFMDANPTGGFMLIDTLPPSLFNKWKEVDGVVVVDVAANALLTSELYKQQRSQEYPSLSDQADMAYWDRKNGTTTLDDALDAVKAEYPKPTE